MTKDKPHHHGNLRAALIQAGIDLLETGGPEALSLRKCALAAGVSHAAPAHHFGGLPGLKLAIAEEAFRLFSASMRQAAETSPPAPRDQLRAICRGYLRFGQEHRALLELIFGVPAGEARDFKIENDAGAYQILRETCAPFVPPGTAPEIIEIQVWSLIHGYTLLAVSGRISGESAIADGPFDQVMSLLDRIGCDPTS